MTEKATSQPEQKTAPPVLDHEHRIYGWLHQVVRDMRTDVLWAMSHASDIQVAEHDAAELTAHNIELAGARAKLHQVVTYCNAALAEADRQIAEWQAERDARKQAALTLSGVPFSPRNSSLGSRRLAGLADPNVDPETGSDRRYD